MPAPISTTSPLPSTSKSNFSRSPSLFISNPPSAGSLPPASTLRFAILTAPRATSSSARNLWMARAASARVAVASSKTSPAMTSTNSSSALSARSRLSRDSTSALFRRRPRSVASSSLFTPTKTLSLSTTSSNALRFAQLLSISSTLNSCNSSSKPKKMPPNLPPPLFKENSPRIPGISVSVSKALLKSASAPPANCIVSPHLPGQSTHNSSFSTNPKAPTSGTTSVSRFRSFSKLLPLLPFSKSLLSPLVSPRFSGSCAHSPARLLSPTPSSPGPAASSTLLFFREQTPPPRSIALPKWLPPSSLFAPRKTPPPLSLGARLNSNAMSIFGALIL